MPGWTRCLAPNPRAPAPPKPLRMDDVDDAGNGERARAEAIRLPSFSVVEVPGGAQDIEEAVAAVGGRPAVAEALKAKAKARLRLRLCRQYQYQAPLPLKRYRTSDLVLRLRKRDDGTWDRFVA
ncbi:hypothetical protein AK812_SmicGene34076 [Symbiodinium microadriaticum]|uniref:Transcription factor IIIC subunit Tfc1/Sfc1 triple barrel domain-containing protein n=1 Tax=Symbiodinium microadriaticum TaxID=2951 RepID=A0A1Q9CQ08_SYMMI|nr:hypothetical protein AK812_SmicGene34076 [Symbiodinium microadriaticum]